MKIKRILSLLMSFAIFMALIPAQVMSVENCSLKDLATANGYEYVYYDDKDTVNMRSASYILSFQNGNAIVAYKTVLGDTGTVTLNNGVSGAGDTFYVSKLDVQTKLKKYFPNDPIAIKNYVENNTPAFESHNIQTGGYVQMGDVVTLAGTIIAENWEHTTASNPSGKMTAYILKLDNPIEVEMIYGRIHTIIEVQVFDDHIAKDFVGKKVKVTGEVSGSAGTIYYRRDVVIFPKDISIIGQEVVSMPTTSGNSPSDWAVTEVNAADKVGLIPDELKGNYTQAITRREFCLLAQRLIKKYLSEEHIEGYAQLKQLEEMRGFSGFSDTDEDCVLMAARLGIVTGYDDGTFKPENSITRQEAAVMLYRCAQVLERAAGIEMNTTIMIFKDSGLNGIINNKFNDVRDKFSDGKYIAEWAVEAITWVSSNKPTSGNSYIMGGVSSTEFSPMGEYTREQGIISFSRLHALATEKIMVSTHIDEQKQHYKEQNEQIIANRKNLEISTAIARLDTAIKEYAEAVSEQTKGVNKRDVSKVAKLYDINGLNANSKGKFSTLKNSIYEALYDYTEELYGEVKDISELTDVNDLTKAILSNLNSNKFEDEYNGYTIEIFPYGRYGTESVGTIICSKWSQEYKYSFNSTLESSQAAAGEFIRQNAELAKNISTETMEEVIGEVSEMVTVFTPEGFLNYTVSRVTKNTLKKLGFGDITKYMSKWNNLYKLIESCKGLTNSQMEDCTDDIQEFLDNFEDCILETESITDSIVKSATANVNEQFAVVKDAIWDYLY